MNLSFLFALAFGTMTADVRVTRAPAGVHARAECAVSVAGRRSPIAGPDCSGDLRPATGDRFVTLVPLTGSISPRAPAVTC